MIGQVLVEKLKILLRINLVESSPLKSPFLLRTPPSDDGQDANREKIAIDQLSYKIFNHLCDEIIIETTFFNIAEILEKKIETKNMVKILICFIKTKIIF